MSTYKDYCTVEEFDETFEPLLEPETVMDGNSGEQLVSINGYHVVTRLFYIVCKQPRGTGDDSDKDMYIEAEY